MEITLNHTIIYVKDKVTSAQWYEKILGFSYLQQWGPFAVSKVNSTLTLDFCNKEGTIPSQHFAFKVNDEQFDEIFARLKSNNVPFCSDPALIDNLNYKINHYYGGRGVYFVDPDGHVLEILTADYDLSRQPEAD